MLFKYTLRLQRLYYFVTVILAPLVASALGAVGIGGFWGSVIAGAVVGAIGVHFELIDEDISLDGIVNYKITHELKAS